jgi:glycosyltransferase involved in cell wall biosynthesis
MKKAERLLSLIVPVYYEQECILQFIKEVDDELRLHNLTYEIIFIDDGSGDNTVELIKQSILSNTSLKLIEFSYNHGKQAAFSAGVAHAKGDLLLYMDPDLQDPPKEIIRFIHEIDKGFDLVFGIREQKKDSFLNRFYSRLFWWTLDKFTGLKIPKGLAVMRIFNRKFANQFLKYGEQNRFIEGLFMHIGMKKSTIVISQRDRFAGVSKFNFKRKMQLAFNAIFDFSDLPLKLATRFGMALIILGFVSMIAVIISRFFIEFQAGWPSLFCVLVTGFGLQIFFLGIVGKYVGNIYRESKGRPLYSIKELHNLES